MRRYTGIQPQYFPRLHYFARKYWRVLALLLVLGFSLTIRLVNLNYNSPFVDEAIYILLGRKVLSATWQAENPFAWVGGMPLFYPPLSALFSQVGGLIGSRFLNVLLGTVSVFLLYIFTSSLRLFGNKEFLNNSVGLISALFFGISSVPIWLSRLAIYDMLAFTLLLFGLVFLQRASSGMDEKLYLLSSALFFLAFLAKYSVAMLFPLIFIALILHTLWSKRDQMVWVVYYFFFVLIFWFSVYVGMNFSELKDFLVSHVVDEAAASSSIISQYLDYTVIWYMLAVPAVAIFLPRKRYLPVLLFISSFIPLVMHLMTSNSATLVQNTLYTLPFLIPLAGVFLVSVAEKHHVFGAALLTVITTLLFTWSTFQRLGLEQSWPNSTEAMTFLKESVSAEEKVLVESDDIALLALSDIVPEENITGAFIFSYQDQDGISAYGKAVADEYFNVIELDSSDSELALVVENNLTERYSMIYENEPFRIFRLSVQ